jgi:hypothetical protein
MAKSHHIKIGNPTEYLYRFYWNNNVSRYRLLNHARAHRAYVAGHNGSGFYTAYLVILDAEILAFSNAISGKMSGISIQKGSTLLTNNSVEAFSAKVHEQHPNISYIFRETPDVILEFYPHGLTEYGHIARENAQVLMDFFNNAVASHSASFDPAIVTWFATQATSYETTRGTQQGNIGNVGEDISLIIATKTSLINALIAGHGIIAYNNSSNVTVALTFWDYSLLYRARTVAHLKVDGETPMNSSVLGKEILLDQFDMIGLWNKGLVARVGVFASLTADGVPGIDTKIKWVEPGIHGTVKAIDIDATINHYIKVCVDNLTDGSPWQLDFYDM